MGGPRGVRASIPALAPSLTLWALFLLGLPFYVFSSGAPQPAYVLVPFLAIPIALQHLSGRTRACLPGEREQLLSLVLFVLYAASVALVWFLLLGEARVLLYPSFYLFNLTLFWIVSVMRARFGVWFDSLTARTLVGGAVLQVALLLVIGAVENIRQSLFFNNPNQLGYYGLLVATVLVMVRERHGVPAKWAGIGVTAAAVLCLASLSRSALLSFVCLMLIALRRRPRWLVAGVAMSAVVVSLSVTRVPPPYRERLFMRTLEIDDSFAGRGYDRILHHPGYLLFGAGEGAFERFDSFLDGEIHSSFGTLVFSYGFVGAALFVVFLLAVFRRCDRGAWLLVMPALAYGLTHQGLRFAMFWVMLGMARSPSGSGEQDAT